MTTCGSPTRLGAMPARVKLPSEVRGRVRGRGLGLGVGGRLAVRVRGRG